MLVDLFNDLCVYGFTAVVPDSQARSAYNVESMLKINL